MGVAIKVPAVGESITEGVLAQWLRKEGDVVQANEPIFELETDKATTMVYAPAAGVLHISVQEGERVEVGAVVGQVDPAGAAQPTAPAQKEAAGPRTRSEPVKPSAEPAQSFQPRAALPAARLLAEEKGVDLNAVPGTGRGGRVTKDDVIRHLEAPGADATGLAPGADATGVAPPAAPPRERRQRMSAIRQRIAERLVQSQKTTATLTTFNEADMSQIMALRTKYKDRFKEKHHVGLGFMSFFVKAAIEALRAFPIVNSRIEGNEIVTSTVYNIGVAVSTEKGLMVPVLREAEKMSFAQIEQAIADLAARARDGKITPDDLQGGTFTITNGGVFGSLLSTPILNPPQSAILGMHTIQKRPVVVADEVVIRPMMYLALSYDHRLIDGREGVLFLIRLKECIEDPERLLLEV